MFHPQNLNFLEIEKKNYLIEIWDIGGSQKYRSVNNIFIKGSKVVILEYDVTDERSFSELNYWVKTTKEILSKKAIYGIVGNKIELIDDKKVLEEEGKAYAEENDTLFCTTSAKEDSKVFQMFVDKLVEKYIEKYFGNNNENNINP